MANIITNPTIIDDLINRRINEAIPGKDDLLKRLLSGERLTIYQGFDPTSPNLHIGHLVGILTLKKFQELGHKVIFLIGDFTATIGDPTGKDKTRTALTFEQVRNNAQTYQDQIQSVLHFDGANPAALRFNSEWLKQMDLTEVLELAMGFTAQQMLERDMFQRRLQEEKPIGLHEFLYPVLVTKDALAMNVDIELGGSDQLFNMSVGRNVIKSLTGKDKMAITTHLLVDNTGKKIGKTEGNAINISDKPEDLYGKIMSLSDEAIMPCFKLITLVPTEELVEIEKAASQNPMQQKKRLAWEIVAMLQGKSKADKAQEHFEKTVQSGEIPQEMPTIRMEKVANIFLKKIDNLAVEIPDLLVRTHMTPSKSEARRLIEQGAVRVDGEVVKDLKTEVTLKPGMIIQAGKRKFIKITD
ncbi:MAG: tyrosine--tRNA ligase [Patescibacteria group bacterium]